MNDKRKKLEGVVNNAKRRPVLIIGGIVGGVFVAISLSYLLSS
ncbi:MAG: hypothetical protein VXW87_05020 [Pseudomonadota bacterium]|nr:hypothetical protein [Pseudomonadota bacterium]